MFFAENEIILICVNLLSLYFGNWDVFFNFAPMKQYRLPAEWEPQSMIQLTWPHRGTDWVPMLDEIVRVYVEMAREIAKREPLLIVIPDKTDLPQEVQKMRNVTIVECPTNDTWARDHGFITLVEDDDRDSKDGEHPHALFLDFCFNGWGGKFAADKDNAINRHLFPVLTSNIPPKGGIRGGLLYIDHNDFVLEGGSIESDGKGTIYTTRCCLMAPHRNQPLTQQQIEEKLKEYLFAERIVWLDDEPLPGDDTDGHIDTLARILPDGSLLRLPLPEPIIEDGEQLPATYANYLILNGAVLVPTYGQPKHDEEAMRIIGNAFPDREIIGIDSRPIIRQHGSIHCCTMQFPSFP